MSQPVADVPDLALGDLAYVDGGDIWVQALPDGESRRITEDGVNAEPSWSPSGDWLAFRKLDSQLWVHSRVEDQNNEVEPGAPVNDFAWSPTEDRLAYTVGSGIVHLRLFDADSGESTILLPPSTDSYPQQLHWHPDGQSLAFVRSGFDEESGQLFDEIRIMPIQGGEPQSLLKANMMEQGSLQLGAWTSDGERLLFWYGPRPIDSFIPETVDLYSIAVDDNSQPRLETEQVSWQDSRFLVTAPIEGEEYAVTVGEGPPWTNKRIFITDSVLTPADQVAAQPAWSPDGAQLAYTGMPDQGEVPLEQAAETMRQRHIWIIDTDGCF